MSVKRFTLRQIVTKCPAELVTRSQSLFDISACCVCVCVCAIADLKGKCFYFCIRKAGYFKMC